MSWQDIECQVSPTYYFISSIKIKFSRAIYQIVGMYINGKKKSLYIALSPVFPTARSQDLRFLPNCRLSARLPLSNHYSEVFSIILRSPLLKTQLVSHRIVEVGRDLWRSSGHPYSSEGGPPTIGCPGHHPDGFSRCPRKKTLQLLWTTCASGLFTCAV